MRSFSTGLSCFIREVSFKNKRASEECYRIHKTNNAKRVSRPIYLSVELQSRLFVRNLSGCLEAWPDAHQVSLYSGNPQNSQAWNLHTIRYRRYLCGSSSSMTRAGSGFALRKLMSFHFKILSHTWGSQASRCTPVSRRIQKTYRTVVVKPFLKHFAQVGHKLGPWQI